LGADLAFDLLGLLISPFGDQLRDLLAHGLIEVSDFNTSPVLYTWWLSLRLCILPFIRIEPTRAETDPEVAEPAMSEPDVPEAED
jgi:hypothetical protein